MRRHGKRSPDSALRQASPRPHRRSQPSDRGDGSGGPIQRPVETAERDEADTERYLGIHDEPIEREASRDGCEAKSTKHRRIGGDHNDHAHDH